MEEYFALLQSCPLFQGFGAGEMREMVSCLGGVVKSYGKGQFLLGPGGPPEAAVVLEGEALLVREDFWGNRDLVAKLGPGALFGEVYACLGVRPSVGVVAGRPAKALFLEIGRVLAPCAQGCPRHARLLKNLAFALAEKSLNMQEKLTHMSKRTTREKLLSYLSAQAGAQGGPSFTIPFNRQQLADYLGVDRSAMSKELCKMRDGGLLAFSKNRFTLLR